MKEIRISQSMIKAFKDDYCPLKNKVLYITKQFKSIPSLSMMKGTYFETLIIGSDAHGNQLTTLPLRKNGKPTVDQERIEQQANFFMQVMKDHSMVIQDKQVKLSHQLDTNVFLDGILDIKGSLFDDIDGPVNDAIIDIKLTANIYSQFGDYCWHFPHNMDHTQAYMYSLLYESNYKVTPIFYYFVFDYKPVPEYKVIRKTVDATNRAELMESIRKTIEKIEMHERKTWWTNGSYDNCRYCPLTSMCKDYKKAKKIEIV